MTFDEYGISGHANHISVHYGVAQWCQDMGSREDCETSQSTGLNPAPPPALSSLHTQDHATLLQDTQAKQPAKTTVLKLRTVSTVRKFLGILSVVETLIYFCICFSLLHAKKLFERNNANGVGYAARDASVMGVSHGCEVDHVLAQWKLTYLAPSQFYRIFCAMRMHVSQFVWYRRFFIILSRYSYMNSYEVMGVFDRHEHAVKTMH